MCLSRAFFRRVSPGLACSLETYFHKAWFRRASLNPPSLDPTNRASSGLEEIPPADSLILNPDFLPG